MTKKAPITELPIHTYIPSEKGRLCLAFIGNLPTYFKGPTVECARQKADAWRHEEVAKLKSAEAMRLEKRLMKKEA